MEAVCVCVKLVEQHIGVLREDGDRVTRRAVNQSMSVYFVVRTNMCVDCVVRNITVVLACTVGDLVLRGSEAFAVGV